MNILAQAVTEAANNTSVAWYQNQTIVCMIGLLVAIPVAVFIGRFLGKTFRSQELNGRLGLIIWCIAASALIIWAKPLKFGVDLRGGVTIIGQMNAQPGVPEEDKVTIQKIIPVLKKRIDPSGVREIVLRGLGKDKMEVIIPDVEREEAERIWKLLTDAGQMFFRIVGDSTQHASLFDEARKTMDQRLGDVFGPADAENPKGKKLGEWVSLARQEAAPGITGIQPYKFVPSPKHLIRNRNTGQEIDIQNLNFGEGDEARIAFTKFCNDNGHPDVEILMAYPPSEKQNVKGEYLVSVQKGFDERAQPRINFKLTGKGGRALRSLTSRNKPRNGNFSLLGIVMDGQLQSAPRINEPIGTDGVIEGSFTEKEIEGYISVLSSGKLDVALRKNWISNDQILSTLGEELKTKGLTAIGISLSLVLVFMLLFYRFCGVVACIALAMNLIFTMSILMLINVNLTLTGLAGLVLTIGMSVDANVLIFERIREELARGSALRMAIRNGFDRATTTIVDANLTTLITAVILYVIGTDQIRSFAVTLIVGILMCMFTAIYCSRVFFIIAERRHWIKELKMGKIVGNTLVDFLSKRKIAAMVSILCIGIGITCLFARGKGILDTDLAGGSTARVEFTSEKDVDEIRTALENANVDYMGDPVRYSVTQMKDNNSAFKVDSSLPVIDDPENYEGELPPKLDEIITKVFTGQLVMLDMNYDPSSITFDGKKIDLPPAIPEPPKFGGPNMGPSFSALNLLELQEGSDQENKKQDDPAKEAEGSEATTPATLVQPVTPPADPAAMLAPTGNQESINPDRRRVMAEFSMTFAHRLSGESVKGYLKDAADSLGDIPMDTRDIQVSSEDAATDHESSLNWDVSMPVYDPADATRILTAVESKMDSTVYFASSSGVGGQVAGQAQRQAIYAMIASLIGIIAYVWIRFQNVAFGLAAIVALVHDVLIVLGAIAVSYWLAGALGFMLIEDFRISLSVVAALLTIIGYSLNDTIVVFDRIREVRGKRTDITAEMINKSISQTLSRTILTSITTLIVVLILYVMGGESIHAFAFALVIGVIVGTYSSIFVASPTLLWLMNRGVAPPTVTPDKAQPKGT